MSIRTILKLGYFIQREESRSGRNFNSFGDSVEDTSVEGYICFGEKNLMTENLFFFKAKQKQESWGGVPH